LIEIYAELREGCSMAGFIVFSGSALWIRNFDAFASTMEWFIYAREGDQKELFVSFWS